jgi:hypothetical protein
MDRPYLFRKFLKNNIDASYKLIDDPDTGFEDKKRFMYIKTGYEQARNEFDRIFPARSLLHKRLMALAALAVLAIFAFLLYFYLVHR